VPSELAASLRLPDPHGSGQGCRKKGLSGLLRLVARVAAIVVAGTIAAAVASTAFAAASPQSKPPRPSARTGHGFVNLRPLWSRFPLEPRRGSAEKRATNPSTRPLSPAPNANGRDRRRHQQASSPLAWVVAAGVASIILLAVVARRRRRSRLALAEDDDQPSWRVAAGGEHGEDGVAPATEWGERAEPASRAGRAPTDAGHVAVDWPRNGHLLFVPTSTGYRLFERPGEAPRASVEFEGEEFGLDGRFRVSKIAASPLPSDKRDCAYLERT
jgi:hypothetical protein